MEKAEKVTFDSVTKVKISGSVHIDATGKIGDDTQYKVEKNGQTLEIENLQEPSINITGNGRVGVLNSGNITYMATGISIIDDRIIANGNASVQLGRFAIKIVGNDLFINGKKYTEDSSSSSSAASEEKRPTKEFWIKDSVLLEEIKLSGAGRSDIDTKHLAKRLKIESIGAHSFGPIKNHPIDNLVASVTGSGDITLSKCEIKNAEAKIAGSGDIDFGNSKVENLTGKVAGSGDISKFVVTKRGNFTLAGSGDIEGRAASGANVAKSKMGSGSIKIRKE